jgi:MerR family transcriptional regulator, heat shock protein HspR
VSGKQSDQNRPLYMISVAADLAGVHPQTLRIYERRQLVSPQRSSGNTRLYSQADVERLRFIQHLTQAEGVNLAGVTRIIELQNEMESMRAELQEAVARFRRAEAAANTARANCQPRTQGAMVRVESGAVVRRFGSR